VCVAGHDVKSLALNLASILFFLLPFALYLYPELWQQEVGGVALVMILALLVPPMGWMRPHPYSDMPSNLPYPRKKD
jgi:hypothetical protein